VRAGIHRTPSRQSPRADPPGAAARGTPAAYRIWERSRYHKDSKKYAATGGWGFGHFANGKPGNKGLMKTCFACHVPARDRDFVITRYALSYGD
jgi:hypothetical protein